MEWSRDRELSRDGLLCSLFAVSVVTRLLCADMVLLLEIFVSFVKLELGIFI